MRWLLCEAVKNCGLCLSDYCQNFVVIVSLSWHFDSFFRTDESYDVLARTLSAARVVQKTTEVQEKKFRQGRNVKMQCSNYSHSSNFYWWRNVEIWPWNSFLKLQRSRKYVGNFIRNVFRLKKLLRKSFCLLTWTNRLSLEKSAEFWAPTEFEEEVILASTFMGNSSRLNKRGPKILLLWLGPSFSFIRGKLYYAMCVFQFLGLSMLPIFCWRNFSPPVEKYKGGKNEWCTEMTKTQACTLWKEVASYGVLQSSSICMHHHLHSLGKKLERKRLECF